MLSSMIQILDSAYVHYTCIHIRMKLYTNYFFMVIPMIAFPRVRCMLKYNIFILVSFTHICVVYVVKKVV